MNKFRLLNADEIECRISQIKERDGKPTGLTLLLYKTARTDANLLDETFGPERWMNDFKLVDGVLYGGIGIIFPEMNGEWIWKWDAGTESNTEAEKGRASDAFKRAGFKWGIGRELYSAPFIWIPADRCTIKEAGKDRNGKTRFACYDNFTVSIIHYDKDSDIDQLEIKNGKDVVFSMGILMDKTTKSAEPAKAPAKVAPPQTKKTDDPILTCEKCKNMIKPFIDSTGRTITPTRIARKSMDKFGRVLCVDCAAEAANAS